MVLKIRKIDLDEIFKHSEVCYPSEACGILIGRKTEKEKFVEKVIFAKNVLGSPVEYEVDAESLFKAFEFAEKNGLEILGFFHSHPHHEPFWSVVDEERGKYWEG
ncbi:MAG: M67 family metallopeptidase, partial [Candidatus Hadarchaeales archaeon]